MSKVYDISMLALHSSMIVAKKLSRLFVSVLFSCCDYQNIFLTKVYAYGKFYE